MPERPKRYCRVMIGGRIAEVDLQDGDVVDDRRRDVGDDEKDGGHEQQERADVVEEPDNSHDG